MAIIMFEDKRTVEVDGIVLWDENYAGYHFALICHQSDDDGMERLLVVCYLDDVQLFEIMEGQFRRDILTERTMYDVQMEFISKVKSNCYALVNGHADKLDDIYEKICRAESVIITSNKDILDGAILGPSGNKLN